MIDRAQAIGELMALDADGTLAFLQEQEGQDPTQGLQPKPNLENKKISPKRKFWGLDVPADIPITSFEAKKWLEVNFPSRGKVIKFPSSRKNSFFSNPSFHGKTGHFKGKGKLFSRENYP